MRCGSVGDKHVLNRISSLKTAFALQTCNLLYFVQGLHESFYLSIRSWVKGRDPVVLKSFLLSKLIKIFRIERGSVVALYSLWSSVGGEGVFQSLLVGLEVG